MVAFSLRDRRADEPARAGGTVSAMRGLAGSPVEGEKNRGSLGTQAGVSRVGEQHTAGPKLGGAQWSLI